MWYSERMVRAFLPMDVVYVVPQMAGFGDRPGVVGANTGAAAVLRVCLRPLASQGHGHPDPGAPAAGIQSGTFYNEAGFPIEW